MSDYTKYSVEEIHDLLTRFYAQIHRLELIRARVAGVGPIGARSVPTFSSISQGFNLIKSAVKQLKELESEIERACADCTEEQSKLFKASSEYLTDVQDKYRDMQE